MHFALLALLSTTAHAEDVEADAPEVVDAVVDVAPPLVGGTVTLDDPHYDLEVLYTEGRIEEGLEKARARMAEVPDDPEVYWHVARFLFEYGEVFDRTDDSVDKKALYQEMIEVSEQGLELSPGHGHLLFAYGVGKGRLGTTRGVLASLFMAKDVERSWQQSLESGYTYSSIRGGEELPCDAHLALGIFYRLVPEWWIVKLLAGTRGDLDKSLSHQLTADECSPGDIGVIKELAVSQLCLGDKRDDPEMTAAGMASLQRLLLIPAQTRTEHIDHRHAGTLIEDPSMACEYSRDGQQDLDKSKLDTGEE